MFSLFKKKFNGTPADVIFCGLISGCSDLLEKSFLNLLSLREIGYIEKIIISTWKVWKIVFAEEWVVCRGQGEDNRICRELRE